MSGIRDGVDRVDVISFAKVGVSAILRKLPGYPPGCSVKEENEVVECVCYDGLANMYQGRRLPRKLAQLPRTHVTWHLARHAFWRGRASFLPSHTPIQDLVYSKARLEG